jgi:hypothetical protein
MHFAVSGVTPTGWQQCGARMGKHRKGWGLPFCAVWERMGNTQAESCPVLNLATK